MSGGFGVGKMDWSPLQAIGQQLTVNAELNRQRELMAALGGKVQSGDYDGAAQVAFSAGDAGTALGVLKLGQAAKKQRLEQDAGQAFQSGLGGLFGGGVSPPGPVAGVSGGSVVHSGAPQAASRAPSFAATGGGMGDYLATTRAKESGGNDLARNPNSSAKGRYQFTDGTWKAVAAKHPELGLTPGGWRDPAQQEKAMAAFTQDNASELSSAGIPINPANLYGAHFLGSAGARKFIPGAINNPDAPAISLVGQGVASANRTVFFNKDGTPKTAGQVYAWMGAGRGGDASAPQRTQVASLGDVTGLGGAPAASAPPQPGPVADQAQIIGQTPVASIAQSPLGQRIPFLLRAAGHPNLPDGQRQLAQTLLKTALDETRMSDEQKDYTLARSQGFGGTFLDYKQALKSEAGPISVAPGSTLVDRRTNQPVFTAPDRSNAQEGEAKLRGEFNAQVKDFGAVQDAFGRVVASVARREADPKVQSPAADMSLVFGFMKMLDPGSVVREGEYATARNAAGVPEQVLNVYNRVLNGEFLNPQQRQDFVNQAQQLYAQARGDAEGKATRYRDLAKQSGFDEGRVVSLPAAPRAPQVGRPAAAPAAPGQPAPMPGQPAPTGPASLQGGPALAAPPGVPTAVNPATGQRLILQDGQWVPVAPPPNTEGRPQA